MSMLTTSDYATALPALPELAERCRQLAAIAEHPVRMRLFELAAAIDRHAHASKEARADRSTPRSQPSSVR